ncbi:putative E3 ubiquitin-protein ligase UBR7 [Copidosoma floridanum]|uniref:putative E3 ubiquitin-protein ligase UBR7 n=1 Tax=Copidosoma floridanum TaxID=29053 RepID=UPI0006C98CE7|nr:putative E3 ubiquitin-protein ligase UBR7 [Copidosoma floridanum]XP_014207419.1 putative E3 ubiquitin-protein ligase UBR7 [Copidosoma floridanum]
MDSNAEKSEAEQQPPKQVPPTAGGMDDENSVTMLDVLQEEAALEEDANAVLGASDDQNCTYSQGYIRQALYACRTCCSEGTRAAICFACSLHCHEGHDLIELYTKRNTKCDCGNSKFGDKSCNRESTKSPENEKNKYNHNYDGFYCICNRPYPDPDQTEDDEMIQCAICEDWYHSKHLDNDTKSLPEDDEYSEMICSGCMKEHDFLWRYATKYSISKDKNVHANPENEKVDVEKLEIECTLPVADSPIKEGSVFWSATWRSSLCHCEKCQKTYEEHGLSYLLDPFDTVQEYEKVSKAKGNESLHEKGMKALASLGHVQQLTAIEEYNKMKDNLKEYLKKFAENKKVVREEDIREFFTKMASQKRQKVVVPTFCR